MVCGGMLTSTHIIINTFSSCRLLIHSWDRRDKTSIQDRVICQSVNKCPYSSVLCSETLEEDGEKEQEKEKEKEQEKE